MLSDADREFIEGYRAKHCKRDGENWLCKCGAILESELGITCSDCVKRAEAEARERAKKEANERFRERLRRYTLEPLENAPNWDHARIDSPDFVSKVHSRLQRFATKYELKHGSVALLGPSGVGKTTAALALVRRLAGELYAEEVERGPDRYGQPSDDLIRWSRSRWVTAHELARARREHRLGQSDAPLIRECMEAPLLVIDEMGFEPTDGTIFEIVDVRYGKRLPTIITSGLTSAEFTKRYGAALLRRLVDDGVGRLLEIGGADGG